MLLIMLRGESGDTVQRRSLIKGKEKHSSFCMNAGRNAYKLCKFKCQTMIIKSDFKKIGNHEEIAWIRKSMTTGDLEKLVFNSKRLDHCNWFFSGFSKKYYLTAAAYSTHHSNSEVSTLASSVS